MQHNSSGYEAKIQITDLISITRYNIRRMKQHSINRIPIVVGV